MSYASSWPATNLHTGGLDDADMNENIGAALAALLRARRTNCTRRQRKPHPQLVNRGVVRIAH